ncbi:unnamed protein product [Gongylonema pulchrum]|uniref:Uncharacterized protein n=1 Tax=Gongylonema pulchrum TaxID=637853 RepID=A0A3P6PIL6_9BILA|nr:unnamed protein product [Gongylonema pulchrum]
MSSLKREPGVGCESPDLPFTEATSADKEKTAKCTAEENEERGCGKTGASNAVALEGIKVTFDQLALDCDKTVIDPALFDESPEGADEGALKRGTLGSGVILLAQQLMRNSDKSKRKDKAIRHDNYFLLISVTAAANRKFRLSTDMTDFRYRTELPEGAATPGTVSSPDDIDSMSSLGSTRTEAASSMDKLSGMLRSHSQMIDVSL